MIDRLFSVGSLAAVYAMPLRAAYELFFNGMIMHPGFWAIYLLLLLSVTAAWVIARLDRSKHEITLRRWLICSFIPLLTYLAIPS